MEKLTPLTFAKAHFSALIDQVEQGEEFVVTRMGRPVARLVKYEPPKNVSRLNFARGKIKIAEDFDTWGDEEAAAFEMR